MIPWEVFPFESPILDSQPEAETPETEQSSPHAQSFLFKDETMSKDLGPL